MHAMALCCIAWMQLMASMPISKLLMRKAPLLFSTQHHFIARTHKGQSIAHQ